MLGPFEEGDDAIPSTVAEDLVRGAAQVRCQIERVVLEGPHLLDYAFPQRHIAPGQFHTEILIARPLAVEVAAVGPLHELDEPREDAVGNGVLRVGRVLREGRMAHVHVVELLALQRHVWICHTQCLVQRDVAREDVRDVLVLRRTGHGRVTLVQVDDIDAAVHGSFHRGHVELPPGLE